MSVKEIVTNYKDVKFKFTSKKNNSIETYYEGSNTGVMIITRLSFWDRLSSVIIYLHTEDNEPPTKVFEYGSYSKRVKDLESYHKDTIQEFKEWLKQ